jgi:hypothetical protein
LLRKIRISNTIAAGINSPCRPAWRLPPLTTHPRAVFVFSSLLLYFIYLWECTRGGQAQGEVSDTKSLESLEKVKAKIDAYEAEAQKSGALDSKNEAERTRLIKDMGKVIGGLQSDDVVSMDIDYRMEKQVQVKRCKQLIANLEMAAMTTSWSSGGW